MATMSTPYVPTSSGRLGVADSLHDPAKAWRLRAGRRQKGADSRERGKRDREGQDVEGIRGRQACGRDQDSCERRTADRPGVRAERSDCIRGGKLVPLDEARRHGVERRPLEPVETRHRDPDHEQRPELRARKERVDEQRACADGEQELRDLDEPPPVERVCERASVQRCQKERRQLREAQEADDERRSGQLVRLVRHRDVRDHRAEEREAKTGGQEPEVAMPSERPDVDRRELQQRACAARLWHRWSRREPLRLANLVVHRGSIARSET
jgi:hypothetical protein